MAEKQIIIILVIVKIVILSLIAIAACIYSIPLCFVRRFHKPLHLLSLNVCIAAFICASYWIIYFTMNTFYQNILWTEQSCLLILYLQTTVNCQVIYALCVVSLNRLFSIVYRNKIFFRSKKWVIICVGAQWVFAALIPSPTFGSSLMVN